MLSPSDCPSALVPATTKGIDQSIVLVSSVHYYSAKQKRGTVKNCQFLCHVDSSIDNLWGQCPASTAASKWHIWPLIPLRALSRSSCGQQLQRQISYYIRPNGYQLSSWAIFNENIKQYLRNPMSDSSVCGVSVSVSKSKGYK